MGLVSSGVGAGMFAMVPLMQIAKSYYGTTGFFIMLAAITANIVTLGMLCFPNNLEKYVQFKRNFRSTLRSKGNAFTNIPKMYYNSVLTKGIIMLSVSLTFYCSGLFSIYFLIPSFASIVGFSHEQSSFFFAISGIAGIPGRLLTGVISTSKHVGLYIPYAGSMAVIALATFIYPFVASYYAGQVIFMTIFGSLVGSPYVVAGPICEMFVPIQFVSSAIGLLYFAGGVGAVVGPVLSGWLCSFLLFMFSIRFISGSVLPWCP